MSKEPQDLFDLKTAFELPSYDVQRLDAAEENDHFRNALSTAAKKAAFKPIEAACIASQSVLYALDELKWLVGNDDPVYHSRLEEAEALFAKAPKHFEAAINACPDQVDEIELFFANIAERHRELKDRLNR